MNVDAKIIKMEEADHPDNTDITFEFEIPGNEGIRTTVWTWSKALASKFKVGQTTGIMLGVSELCA